MVATFSLNFSILKSFFVCIIISIIFLIESSSCPCGSQAGCSFTITELIPNSSILNFKSSKICIFSFKIMNSSFESSIVIGKSNGVEAILGFPIASLNFS